MSTAESEISAMPLTIGAAKEKRALFGSDSAASSSGLKFSGRFDQLARLEDQTKLRVVNFQTMSQATPSVSPFTTTTPATSSLADFANLNQQSTIEEQKQVSSGAAYFKA